ncbi:SLBB domain-containing protein [Lyngbya aestuarii]|uniref:SLBB domain-containing protein n=1 Tax=Lyngbya aestuarii TaxID=118322 RepID=UPI00403D80A5
MSTKRNYSNYIHHRKLPGKQRLDILSQSNSSQRRLTQPIAGLTLLALLSFTTLTPAQAQLPGFSPVAPSRATSLPSESAYTLGSGDRLRVDVFNVPEYSGEFQVLPNGTLNLPVVGSVSVQGLTLEGASQILANRYSSILKRPLINLSLLTPRPLKFSVAGEVSRPGAYSLPLSEGQKFPTITEVIKLAGGHTQAAALRDVQLQRNGVVYNINLWDLIQNGNLNQDVNLRDGDEIFIPTLANVDLNESRQLADASFAADEAQAIKVAVVGEVVRPGPYTVAGATSSAANADQIGGGGTGRDRNPPTVTQAIQVAGGITQLADIRQVKVQRKTRSGLQQDIEIDLWRLLQAGDLSQDLILQAGDTIIVPTASSLTSAEATELASASFSAAIIRVNVVGEVNNPGVVEVPANTPMNQALLSAGGFDNRRARKKAVYLVRLQPDGTVQKREIQIDFTAPINDETNPPLRPNDVLVVGRSGLARISDTLNTILSPVGSFFSIFNLLNIGGN